MTWAFLLILQFLPGRATSGTLFLVVQLKFFQIPLKSLHIRFNFSLLYANITLKKRRGNEPTCNILLPENYKGIIEIHFCEMKTSDCQVPAKWLTNSALRKFLMERDVWSIVMTGGFLFILEFQPGQASFCSFR